MNSLEAQMSVIGCLLLEFEECKYIFARLPAKCFLDDGLRSVYAYCYKQNKMKQPVDYVLICAKFGDKAKLVLAQCMEMTPSVSRLNDYANAVIEDYRIDDMNKSILAAYEAESADEKLVIMQAMMDKQIKIKQCIEDSATKDFTDSVIEFIENLYSNNQAGYDTGFSRFDSATGSLHKGEMFALSGRSGSGKTDFALNLALRLAKKKVRVLYLSMEMTRVQLFQRYASNLTGIDSKKIRNKERLSDSEKQQISNAFSYLVESKIPLFTDEGQRLTIPDIENKILSWKPEVIFIDHIGLMKSTNAKKNYWESAFENSQELKALATKYKIVMVTLTQQNSRTDTAKDKKAVLSDLKGTDGIGNDADIVGFMSAEEGNIEGSEWLNANIQFAKNRNGTKGTIDYHWRPQYHDYTEVLKI